jgi:cytochrome c biogenesis protein CcmG/thiol:disulfide interchange protein DsbE
VDLPPALPGGQGLSAKDLKDGPLLVNFFASWCLSCVAEQHVLDKAAKSGVVIYGVDYKDKQAPLKKWLGKNGNPYRRVGADADGRAGIDWGITGVPETFVVDANGIVLYRHAGPVTREVLDRDLRPLLEARK